MPIKPAYINPSSYKLLCPYNGQNDTFTYDNLNRLTSGVSYQPNGNITYKANVGQYIYDPQKKHAVDNVSPELRTDMDHQITYDASGKTSAIISTNSTMYQGVTFGYNPDKQRCFMVVFLGNEAMVRYYAQNHEYTYFVNNGSPVFEEVKDYIYSPYGLVAMRKNGVLNPVATDHLGSIVAEFDINFGYLHYGYDAWGRRYRYQSGSKVYFDALLPLTVNLLPEKILDFFTRGYTGHEHLDLFGLINMNGRMYDPMLGRMLSPDPYVPDGTFTQDFNRYAYARNNPLMYTDPSGEFLFGFIAGFWKGLINNDPPFKTAFETVGNQIKITAGLFASDPNKNFGGRLWEVTSRFTWQLPQTLAGNAFSRVSNHFGQVDNVDFWGGATVLSGNFWGSGGAMTLGSYINGGRSLAADPNDALFQHEYGHYLQSQEMGWGYIPRVGIPSLMSTFYNDDNHDFQPFEQDANLRAFLYFNENVAGFYKSFDDRYDNRGWNFYTNPLDVYHKGEDSRGDYYDYHNFSDMSLINSLSLHAKWNDHLSWLIGGIPWAIGVGISNGIYYYKYRIR